MLLRQGGIGCSGAALGGAAADEGEGLTSLWTVVGVSDEANNGLASLDVVVGVADEVGDDVGFKEQDRSLSGRLAWFLVSDGGSTLLKGGASCT